MSPYSKLKSKKQRMTWVLWQKHPEEGWQALCGFVSLHDDCTGQSYAKTYRDDVIVWRCMVARVKPFPFRILPLGIKPSEKRTT